MSGPAALPIGAELSHFRITAKIGAGGMGEVFRAHDLTLERDVAMKVLPGEMLKEADRVRRFVQEAKAASALNHPNIVTIYEIGQVPLSDPSGSPTKTAVHYIAMEFIEGETLRAMIYRSNDRRRLLEILAQVTDGLAKAHGAGIIHRDLKPDNVMISADGFAKIVDFGLAKLTEQKADAGAGLTQEGMVMGSVGYMSPEQVQGMVVDARSDIFSFGCILYEALTRKRPFHADLVFDTLHKIVFAEPEPVDRIDPTVPPALARVVNRCLAKKLEDRYQNIREIGADLRAVLRGAEPAVGAGDAPTVMATPESLPALGGGGGRVASGALGRMTPPAGQPQVPASGGVASGAVRRVPSQPSAAYRHKRRVPFKRIFSTSLLLIAAALGGWIWWTYPNLRALEQAPPKSTARIEAAAARGQALPLYHWVSYDAISPALRRAVLATDDPHFYEYNRPTVEGMKRAWAAAKSKKGFKFAPSPIARNVARELYLGETKNPLAPVQIWAVGVGLEYVLTKRQLLEIYLNVAPFGDGAVGAEAAARKHFSKKASSLTTSQSALLAAARESNEWELENPSKSLASRKEELQAAIGKFGSSSSKKKNKTVEASTAESTSVSEPAISEEPGNDSPPEVGSAADEDSPDAQ